MGGSTWGDFPCCSPGNPPGGVVYRGARGQLMHVDTEGNTTPAAELGAAEADRGRWMSSAEAFQEWNASEVAPAKRLGPGEAYTDHDLEAAFIAGAIWAADRLTRGRGEQ